MVIKGDMSAKVLYLLNYLEQKGGSAGVDEVMHLFEITEDEIESILKEIAFLEVSPSVCVSLDYDRENRTIEINPGLSVHFPFALDERESIAFLFALLAFEEYVGKASRDYESLIQMMKNSMPKLILEAAQKEMPLFKAVYPFKEIFELIEQISHAIQKRKRIKFTYYSIAGSRQSSYVVLPLRILYCFNKFYLWAYDREDETVKSFLIENISDLNIQAFSFELTEEILKKLEDKLRDFTERRYEQFVTLKASGFSAKYIDEIFADFEKEHLNNGDLLIKVPLISVDWLVSKWIMPFNGEVVVLEPEEVKKEAISRIEKILQRYE